MKVKNNRKLPLLLLLSEASPAVLSSSSTWVHSINKERETHGEYHHLMPHLRKDPKKFKEYFS